MIPSLEVGGAQTFLFRFAVALGRQHEVAVYDIHPAKRDDSLVALFPKSVPVYSSLYERLELFLKKNDLVVAQRLLRGLNAKAQLRRWLDLLHFRWLLGKSRIELIHSHMYLGDIFCVFNATTRIPIVSTFHGCYNLLIDHIEKNPEQETTYISQFVEIFSRIDAFVWLTKDHLALFRKYPSLRRPLNQQIYNGFAAGSGVVGRGDPRRDFGIPDDSFVYAMVARGDPAKGWRELIEAFLLLQRRTTRRVDLLLVGWSDQLKALAEAHGQHEGIHFVRQTDRPLDYIAVSQVGMLPTYFKAESLPNTIIEYLYCGKPCIATAVAEIPNMLSSEDGMAGILVESFPEGRANVSSLSNAMESYLREDGLYEQHCKGARKAFQKFSMETCIEKYNNLFHSIVGTGQ